MSLIKKDILTVDSYKYYLLDKNNEKTKASIRVGFTWKGLVFSMSDLAQINWSNFLNIPDNMFPYEITSKDDGDELFIELSERESFYFFILDFKAQLLKIGTDRRKTIKSCTTIEALKEIELTEFS